MSRDWRQLPERGTTFALWLIIWIGLRLGRWAGRLLLYPITTYFLVTISPVVRQASREYLRRVLGLSIHWWHVGRHFYVYASVILDRVFFLSDRFEPFDIEINNGQLIIDQVKSQQGCLLLSAHLGSFEVLRAIGLSWRQLPIKILMNVSHNERMSQVLDTLNPEMAKTIIPLGQVDSLLKVKKSLEQGYLVGMLADRVLDDQQGSKTVSCQFLGQKARFPSGPMQLAILLRCPVILAFGLRRSAKRYDVYFEKLTERIESEAGTRDTALQYWTQRYAERLEHHTRSAPYNWFNFYDFWAAGAD